MWRGKLAATTTSIGAAVGIEAARLGKSYRKALRAEKRDGREPLDSNLEARFVYYLKELKVPRWQLHQPIPPLGTGHRADFTWSGVPPCHERFLKNHLAVFIDGPVHGLPKRYADTMRCVNLCSFVTEWQVLRFADTELELGAQCVSMWHAGLMGRLVAKLRETK